MKYIFLFLLCFWQSWVFAAENAEKMEKPAKQELVYFLTLADIHFDPFLYCPEEKTPCSFIEKLRRAPANEWAAIFAAENSPPSRYGQDTNYALLTSSLAAAKHIAEKDKIAFVLVLGDLLGHEMHRHYHYYSQDKSRASYRAFVQKMLMFLTASLKQAFPHTSVFIAVGNNDSYQGDYFSELNGAFFKEAASIFASLNNENNRSFQQAFSRAGYFAVDLPNVSQLRLIMLNTNLFSNKARGHDVNLAAQQQLDWFSHELASAKAKRQKVLIAMHIPLGIDVYQTLKLRQFRLVEFWNPIYAKRFQAEIDRYAPQIAGVWTGHLHIDTYRHLTHGPHAVIGTGVPAISPIIGTNPGFKVYCYAEQEEKLVDSVTYYTLLNEENFFDMRYQFNRMYHPNCFACPQIVKADFAKLSNMKWLPFYWCPLHPITADHANICVV